MILVTLLSCKLFTTAWGFVLFVPWFPVTATFVLRPGRMPTALRAVMCHTVEITCQLLGFPRLTAMVPCKIARRLGFGVAVVEVTLTEQWWWLAGEVMGVTEQTMVLQLPRRIVQHLDQDVILEMIPNAQPTLIMRSICGSENETQWKILSIQTIWLTAAEHCFFFFYFQHQLW